MSQNAPIANPRNWWFAGMRSVFCLPALVLMMVFVGFASLARQSGLSLPETMFIGFTVWALPAMLVLVSGILAGYGLLTIFVGVALSSLRLAPMVMALAPEIRTPNTPRWKLLALSHFIAITAWVVIMQRRDAIPPAARLSYFAGFAITLTFICTAISGIAYVLAANLPPIVNMGLFFMPPVYFAAYLWASASGRSDRLALGLGLVMGPLFYLLMPGFDIILTGVVGGPIAYLVGRTGQV